MTATIQIRAGRLEDAERLKEIGVTGWETTYAGFIEPANRRIYLESEFWSVERLRAVIQDRRCTTFVAERDGAVTGFLTVEPRGDNEVELTRLYVDPDARGGGIGRALWHQALKSLQTRGEPAVLVNVFGDNADGRRFYERLGFSLIEETTTEVGSQAVYDVWYMMEL